MIECGIRLSYFFRCLNCGKLHCRAYVWSTSKCACGMSIYRQSFMNPSAQHGMDDPILRNIPIRIGH